MHHFSAIGGGGRFELKSNMIHWLPKFHGVSGEDPNKHLTTFELVCSSMRIGDVPVDQVYLRAFFFSLEGAARHWLYYQPSACITSWSRLKSMFLEKYFPASKSAILRREICSAKQLPSETLYEYWERFWRLVASCPNHQISEELLIQYFYERLSYADRTMIDAASGGALVEKTHTTTKQLIDTMAKNSRQFGMRSDQGPVKRVNEIDTSSDVHQGSQPVSSFGPITRSMAKKLQAALVMHFKEDSAHLEHLEDKAISPKPIYCNLVTCIEFSPQNSI